MLAPRAQKYRHAVSIQLTKMALKRTGNYSGWRQGALKLLKMAPKRAESALDGAKRADLTHHGARRALSWRRAHLCGAPARNRTHRVANKAIDDTLGCQ